MLFISWLIFHNFKNGQKDRYNFEEDILKNVFCFLSNFEADTFNIILNGVKNRVIFIFKKLSSFSIISSRLLLHPLVKYHLAEV